MAASAGMELLDMANRDHLIIADAIVSKRNAPGTMILRDEEVPALFTNKISASARPGRCRPRASLASFRKSWTLVGGSRITGAAHRFDADGRIDD